MTASTGNDSWATRTRYIAELVGADAVEVKIAAGDAVSSTYASHNLNGSRAWGDGGTVARAIKAGTMAVAAVATPLADHRVASDLCVAPLVWEGRVIGSLSALRVDRRWDPESQRTLGRSADLVALELAETHSRLWWQRTAEVWKRRVLLLEEVRRELGVASDASEVVESAAQRIATIAGATGASVMLLDAEGQLVVRSAFGPHERAARSARHRIGEGISGWVA